MIAKGITVLAITSVCIAGIFTTTLKKVSEKRLYEQHLVIQIQDYVADGLYNRALPLVEELYYMTPTPEICYFLANIHQRLGNSRSAQTWLEETLKTSCNEVHFLEAARIFLEKDYRKGMEIIRKGIERTGSQQLYQLYQEHLYDYAESSKVYTSISEGYGDYRIIEQKGLYGVMEGRKMTVEPVYDAVMPSLNGRTLVTRNQCTEMLDSGGNRYALCKQVGTAFSAGLQNGWSIIKTIDEWEMVDDRLRPIEDLRFLPQEGQKFSYLGTYSDGYQVYAIEGKYGIRDNIGNDVLAPKYAGILCDEFGRAVVNKTCFVKSNGYVLYHIEKGTLASGLEDAKPFFDGTLAAIKKNGKWGFIDTEGVMAIQPQYEDAGSFDEGLAPVKINGYWGYIDMTGKLVIPCKWLGAKSFHKKIAAVQTEYGWKTIALRAGGY